MNDKVKPEDKALFRESVGRVTPVRHERIVYRPQPPRPVPRFRKADEAAVLRDMLSEEYDPADISTGEELVYLRAGMQQRTLKKLRRGLISVDAELDLHGMTVTVARSAVAEFLHECQRRHIQCSRIIHGKGLGSRHRGPVLKNKLGSWLQQRDEVLAYCSARAYDGGTGAVYVLLKRQR